MRLVAVLLILLSPAALSPSERREFFVVWNVGQGLWTTRVSWDDCEHYDTGGERLPLAAVKRLCPRSRLFYSHGDWDHVGGLPRLRKQSAEVCVAAAPGGKMREKKRRRIFGEIRDCGLHEGPTEIRWTTRGKDSNSASRVFVRDGFLLPGDSPSGEEKFWATKLPSEIRVLLLGHHGSRTSTSEFLLARLPHIKMAIASARLRKYGHPHPVVVARLKRARIPLLRTEEWGNFFFER